MAKLKTLLVCQKWNLAVSKTYLIPPALSWKPCKFDKNKFSASNFFMHIFYTSVTYLHSVEKIQWKL